MKKIRTETKAEDAAKVMTLVTKLNRYRHEYYNLAAPSVSDALYDHLFDELQELEKRTGIILSNSPTQTVGAVPVSSLKKVKHTIPLLSLDKTKQMEELLEMAARSASLLMLKLDGLTVKLCYENGRLVEASTRGDGETGEMVTHNIPAFYNVPVSIPHKDRLVVTGEGIIHLDDFERIKGEISDGNNVKQAGNAAVKEEADIEPCVYLDELYREYETDGMKFDEIVDKVYRLILKYEEDMPDVDLSGFRNWETIRGDIYPKLVNAEQNKELLEKIPHRNFMDLAVVYYAVARDHARK